MLVKVIVTLVILIAIGALGFTLLGEGVFNSVDRAAAAGFAEDSRDLDQMIEIYEALEGGASAFDGADNASAVPDTTATLVELNDFLTSDAGQNVLDARFSEVEYDLVQEGAEYYIVSLGLISDETCQAANDIFTGQRAAATTFATDIATTLGAGVEGGCIETALAGPNTLVYPLGQ